ncbi:MAG: phosphotransferase, partial [Thermoanaerobaculaceae bacterium]|nr:phosphotransferase [Thermoanaerobaculaceae bacterium]
PERGMTSSVADGAVAAAACARVAVLTGSEVVAAAPARWGFTNQTWLATLADGRRVAVQLLAGREVARRRLRVGARLAERLAAAGVPTAPLLGGDAGAAAPFALHAFVAGRNGAETLAADAGAVRLARLMGALVPRLAAVDTRGLRLPSTWADPARLAGAARRWLGRAAPRLDAATSTTLLAAIASLDTLFAGRRPVFAHGDFAPVNVLVVPTPGRRAEAIAALLDLEFARLADPLLDAAWWGWIVRFHHPARWDAAWPAFLAAAGRPDASAAFADRVRALQLLRLLELLVRAGRRAADTWAARLAVTARW